SRSNISAAPFQASQQRAHLLPLLAQVAQLARASLPDAVILALTTRFADTPVRLDEAAPFQAMEDRVEHAVGPAQFAARQLTDLPDELVTVAIRPAEQREDQRHGRSRHELLRWYPAALDRRSYIT